MTCELCRESISARLDAEPEPADNTLVDAHLRTCSACSAWQTAAAAATRTIRVRPAYQTPDLAKVLRLRLRPRPTWLWSRLGLGAVALSQLGVVIYLVIRSISGYTTGDHANGHLFHEGIAWNLALGIAFLIAATRAQRTDGLMPILLVFVVVITAFSIPDLLTGTASVARVLRHLPAVLGLALMYLDNRGYGPTPHRPLLKDSDDTGPTPSAARAA